MASFLGLDYVTPLNINSRGRVFRSETLNLKTQTVSNGTQRWDLTINLEPTTSTSAATDLAIDRAMNGVSKSFLIPMPQHLTELQTARFNTDGVTDSGDDRLNLVATSSGTIKKGQFITVGADTKVYQIVSNDATVTLGANATVVIFPPLVRNTIDGQGVNGEPDISVYYAADGVDGISYAEGIVVRATINVVEALV